MYIPLIVDDATMMNRMHHIAAYLLYRLSSNECSFLRCITLLPIYRTY
jgi:hypothetical protein